MEPREIDEINATNANNDLVEEWIIERPTDDSTLLGETLRSTTFSDALRNHARSNAILTARLHYENGDVGSALRILQDAGFNGIESTEILTHSSIVATGKKAKSTKEMSMEQKIRHYLRGNKVEGITDSVVDEFYAKEKKLRFLVKDERDGLHKPLSDGKKPTSSVKLDDLVPKD